MYPDSERTGDDSLPAAWLKLIVEARVRPCPLKLPRRAAPAPRDTLWKERLRRLRPGQRRVSQRWLGVALTGVALLLALAASPGRVAASTPDASMTVTNGAKIVVTAQATQSDLPMRHHGARRGFDAVGAWRDGVTAFSARAVGDNERPNAITWEDFDATSGIGGVTGMWATALIGLVGLGLSAFIAHRRALLRALRRSGAGPPPAAAVNAPDAAPGAF